MKLLIGIIIGFLLAWGMLITYIALDTPVEPEYDYYPLIEYRSV